MSGAVQLVNPNADLLRRGQAISMNIQAARGLQDVLRSNLGPKGTLKMLVSGAGDIKLTKDGCSLLHEMQIQNPTACMIARVATAQDDVTGDGTTSNVLIIGELMKQCERFLSDGVHPRLLTEGIEKAKAQVIAFLEDYKISADAVDRDLLLKVAGASLRTKLHEELADMMTEIVVDAVLCINQTEEQLDLHMIEILHMQHKQDMDTKLVKGIVMDHGSRHPNMPKRLEKCHVLSANFSLEYEKSEVQSGFYYSSAEQRENMVVAERKWVDDRVAKVIALKKEVCKDGESFVVVNQKGIDPNALDQLAAENIIALRRAKKRNMERIALACGGNCCNNIDDMSAKDLGYAGAVYEQVLGEDKFTFVEDVKNPFSCTIMVKGPHPHVIAQVKAAIRDGLHAVKNVLEDKFIVAGAGAFELGAHKMLYKYRDSVEGRAKLGVQAFADALLVIPKVLAENAGYDPNDTVLKLDDSMAKSTQGYVGLDLSTGDGFDPTTAGIYDNYRVKRQMIDSSAIIATQLLLVDEVMRAGRQIKKN